ncbi:MAG: DapH/DapD/GlmU-related protein, partial [Bdellovibrionales bacterium]
MVFTNVINPRSAIIRKNEYLKTVVRRGATIGANATIVCGIELGEYCFVGAGAVVTKSVAPYSLVLGAPGRPTGWVCTCGNRLDGKGRITCRHCQKNFNVNEQACKPL